MKRSTNPYDDIGKLVKGSIGIIARFGVLERIDPSDPFVPYLIRGDDHLTWVKSYELIEEPMRDLEHLEEGDIVVNSDGYYRRILAVLGGEGELKVYAISVDNKHTSSGNLKRSGGNITAYQLKKEGYSLYSPDDQKTKEALAHLESVGKIRNGKVVV